MAMIALAGAGLMFGLTAAQSPAAVSRPPQFQVNGWSSSCWPGTDGFAANCEGHKKVGGLILRLAVADSQFVQSIEDPECPPSVSRFVFREEMSRFSVERRRQWVAAGFARLRRELVARCPSAAEAKLSDFADAPDISTAGEEELH